MTRESSSEHDPGRSTDHSTSSNEGFDDALRQRFAAERAHDAATVPTLARVLAPRRAPSARRLLWPAFALGAVAIVIVAAGVWRRTINENGERASFVLVPGQMRVPTDFLLDLATNATTRAGVVPSIGAIDWYPLVPQSEMAPNTTPRRN